MLTACSITTYGVSLPLTSLPERASLNSFDDDNGAKYAVYEEGIDMPVAVDAIQTLESETATTWLLTFQQAHGTIETLWAKFVVAEGSE